ncbi:jg9747 [Pararge aegeria aegeria]|uniref:Jg9747 protein n=1 Tax=Pararge aegeria aegeria TaxID=348720 RepID=A0A8S4QZD8_9NEOP|nr:jg9747 [Pararge aegeria aegeria]
MWIRSNAGSRITDYDIAGLVNEAITKVARLDVAVFGFKCTGIYPFDRQIFSDLDYLAADMTNIPQEQIETPSNALSTGETVVLSNSVVEQPETSLSTIINEGDSAAVGGSALFNHADMPSNVVEDEFMEEPTQFVSEPIATSPIPSTSSAADLVQLIHKLSPLPDAAKKRTAARKRKCERSEILTSSPYKKVVEEVE